MKQELKVILGGWPILRGFRRVGSFVILSEHAVRPGPSDPGFGLLGGRSASESKDPLSAATRIGDRLRRHFASVIAFLDSY